MNFFKRLFYGRTFLKLILLIGRRDVGKVHSPPPLHLPLPEEITRLLDQLGMKYFAVINIMQFNWH